MTVQHLPGFALVNVEYYLSGETLSVFVYHSSGKLSEGYEVVVSSTAASGLAECHLVERIPVDCDPSVPLVLNHDAAVFFVYIVRAVQPQLASVPQRYERPSATSPFDG